MTIRMTPARRSFLLAAINDRGRIRRVSTEHGTLRFEAGVGSFPAALREDLGLELLGAGLIELEAWDVYRVTDAGRAAAGAMR